MEVFDEKELYLFKEYGIQSPSEISFFGQLLDTLFWIRHHNQKKQFFSEKGVFDPATEYFLKFYARKEQVLRDLVNKHGGCCPEDGHVIVSVEYGVSPVISAENDPNLYVASVRVIEDPELGTLFIDDLKKRVYSREKDGICRLHEQGEIKHLCA